jgi:translation initiation factor 1
VRNLDPRGTDLAELAARLKSKCGAGGTVKDGAIELQGEHLDRVLDELKLIGFQTKRT